MPRFASLLLLGLVACGETGSVAMPIVDGPDPEIPPPVDSPPVRDLDVRFRPGFARSAHDRPGGGFVVLVDRPVDIRVAWGSPDRELLVLHANGTIERRIAATAGRELVDAVVHPSGKITRLEATPDGWHLVRDELDERLVDDAIYTDPPGMHPDEPRRPLEEYAHDSGRLLADGEGAIVAARTGRHSVILYRLTHDFHVAWRRLVVPAHVILPTMLTGGTYDTFGQLESQYAVHLARDGQGILYIATSHARLDTDNFIKAHEKLFGERLATDPDALDVFVSRYSTDGIRFGTSVVGTEHDDQLYGLRGGATGAWTLGRTEIWNEQGTGFDALVGKVDGSGNVTVHRFDVDRGDIAFDAIEKAGDLLVVGASGYAQNPKGASITEESSTFARWLHRGDRIALPNGPRHSEARFVSLRGGGFLVGGMLDGPGTHSADGDVTLLRAAGFVTFVR